MNRFAWLLGVALVLANATSVSAQQQQPSASATADMRLWAKAADGSWVPVVLDTSGNIPTSAEGGGTAQAGGPQLPPSASFTTDARLWGKSADGLWIPIIVDAAGRLPVTSTSTADGCIAWTCRVTITLTDEQIKALPSAPVVLVAAPGAHKTVRPIASFFTEREGNQTYGNVSPDAHVGIGWVAVRVRDYRRRLATGLRVERGDGRHQPHRSHRGGPL